MSACYTFGTLQACEDLVAAVDFDDDLLVAGFEDTNIAIWTINDAQLLRRLTGHVGGITGVKLNGNLFATSSYDGTVRLWTVDGLNLATFEEPNHLLRCVGFSGSTLCAGDFGGHVHIWELEFHRQFGSFATDASSMVRIKKYHHTQSHKSHVVCLQMNVGRIVTGSRDKTVLVQDFWASAASRR